MGKWERGRRGKSEGKGQALLGFKFSAFQDRCKTYTLIRKFWYYSALGQNVVQDAFISLQSGDSGILRTAIRK